MTQQLAQALTRQGQRVAWLRWPGMTGGPVPEGVTLLTPERTDDEALRNVVQRVQQLGTLQWLVHLHPAGADKELIPAVFWLAKQLQPILCSSSHYGSFLVSVRVDGTLGYGATAPFDWRAAGLSGLVKSLNHEWATVQCRTVDLHPELDPGQVVDCLLAELHDPDLVLAEVGYNAELSRVTPVTEPTEVLPASPTPTIQPSDVILVTGGARGITADCVVALARATPGTFILMGRTSHSPRTGVGA